MNKSNVNTNDFIKSYEIISEVTNEINKVVLGKVDIINNLIASILANGHILLEDVPGVGKTTLATTFSKVMNLEYKRVQFTPDIMPSDITGFSMFNKKTNEFEFKKGAAMCNVLLADEINRTSPKTQSSLLEIMEEGNVTVDGNTYQIPQPFFVIATQNPIGFIGTQQLPESQLDRFSMKLSMGYPDIDSEINIINNRKSFDPLDTIKPIASAEDIILAQTIVKNIYIDNEISRYIVQLISATRNHNMVELGGSPRASLSLMRLSQAVAFLNKRDYVIPDDVLSMFYHTLNHRIILKNSAKLNKISVKDVLKQIRDEVKVPCLKA